MPRLPSIFATAFSLLAFLLVGRSGSTAFSLASLVAKFPLLPLSPFSPLFPPPLCFFSSCFFIQLSARVGEFQKFAKAFVAFKFEGGTAKVSFLASLTY